MAEIRIALIGLGKISIDQHIPAIEGNAAFSLVGTVSPRSTLPGVPAYPDLETLLEKCDVDAVAINTPPRVRFGLARQGLLAGKHVLLEKPPCSTVGELGTLARSARDGQVALYTGWHSQHAPAVAPARSWLRDRRVRQVVVTWCEDVRQWHPGQRWIWQPGGFGVFDPGINAFSLLTAILPCDMTINNAILQVPGNCHTPMAAHLSGGVGATGQWSAKLDFLHSGTPEWSIKIDTDRGMLEISRGGADLAIDGAAQEIGPSQEYSSIYRHFADLVSKRAQNVDAAPLALTADAFLIAEYLKAAEFFG